MRVKLTELQRRVLAEVCPQCHAAGGIWCLTKNQRMSRRLHEDRFAVAEYRAEGYREAGHAAQLAAMSDVESMKP